jgi:hypothetical protein
VASSGFKSQDHRPRPTNKQSLIDADDAAQPQIQPGTTVHPDAAALSSAELAKLDQMEAGLREGDTAPEAAPSPSSAEVSTPAGAAPASSRPQTGGFARGESAKTPSSKPAAKPAAAATSSATPGAGATGGQQNFAGRALSFGSKHRKKFIAGGGIAGIILGLIMSLIGLLPLKLEAIMKNIIGHETARAETYVTRRVDTIIFRYLYQRATGLVASDGFYVGNGIIRTLYGNLSVNNFEKKIWDEKGIKVEKTGPRSVKFTMGDGTSFNANSETELINHLNTDLKGKQARVAIKAIVNDTYKPWQFLKRRHIRKYMQNAYNIRRWSIKKQKDTSDPAKPDLVGSTEADIQSNSIDPAQEVTVSSIDCAVGVGECPDNSKRANPDGTSETRPPAGSVESNTAEPAAVDSSKQGIRDSYKAMKEASTKALEAGISKLFGTTVTKILFKAVPVVGWMALAADLDKFFWDGSLNKIGIALHSAQYAGVAATWASLADQMKAGDLTATQINVIMTKLNNVEKSNAIQRISFDNQNGGTLLPDDKRVGSDVAASGQLNPTSWCDWDWGFNNINTLPPTTGSGDFWTFIYRKAAGALGAGPLGFHTPLCALHGILTPIAAFVNFLLGDLLSAVFNAIIDGANALASGITGQKVDIMASAQEGIAWLMNQVWQPVVTGRETDAALGNAIDAGWDVTANQMCRDSLGCKNISYPLAYAQQSQIIADNRADLSQQNIIARLLNTDYPQSYGSQMLVMLPGTPAGAIDRLSSTSLAMIANPFRYFGSIFSSFFSGAHAATTPGREPNGVQQTGYDESQLADPNLNVAVTDIAGPPGSDGKLTGPDGRVDQYDCPVISDASQPNQCLLDTAAAQALCAGTSKDDDGGLGGNGDPGLCGDVVTPPTQVNPVPTGPTPGLPAGTSQQLAQQLLDNPNVTKSAGALLDLQLAAAGKPATAGAYISNYLLSLLLKLAQTHSYAISDIEGRDPARSASSPHYTGDAVDIYRLDGQQVNGRNAPSLVIMNLWIPLLPSGSAFGQSNCGATPPLPAGIITFSDSCNHLHTAIPKGTP